MILVKVLGIWLLAGGALFGWRRLASGKESRGVRIVPRSNERRA